MEKSKSCRVILFAKAPVAGAVKTRLIPALGVDGAVELHKQLVVHALQILTAADVGPVEICCAPDASHPFFVDCSQRFGVTLTQQCDGDLGVRMQCAFDAALLTTSRALIIGADCPSISIEDVRLAAASLDAHDAALIPADDGGYVLIGARATHASMFDGIDWGNATVLASQRERFRAIGWRWHEGTTRWDVDRPADLARLVELDPQFALKSI
jgi:rSAM/selenodomain-associated transferase 1